MAHRQPPLIIQTQFGNGSLPPQRGHRPHHGISPPPMGHPRGMDLGLPHVPDAPPAVDFGSHRELARRARPSSPTIYLTPSSSSSRYPSRRRVELHDSRSDHITENQARSRLTTYVVIRLEKQDTTDELDAFGNEIKQTWQAAVHHHLPDVSQEEAAYNVRMLTKKEGNVTERKQKLLEPIQIQLEKAQESLDRHERDPRFHHILAQFVKKTHTFERSERDHDRYHHDLEYSSSKKHKDSSRKHKHKSSRSFLEPSRSRSKSKSKQKIKHTLSLTAYFKRTPRSDVSCLKMLQEKELEDEALEDDEEEDYEDEEPDMLPGPPVVSPHPHLQHPPHPQPGAHIAPPQQFGDPMPLHQGHPGPQGPLNRPPQGLGVQMPQGPPPPLGHHGAPSYHAHPPPPPPPPGPAMPPPHQARQMPGPGFGPPPPPPPGPFQPGGAAGHVTGQPPAPPPPGFQPMPPNVRNAHHQGNPHVHGVEDLADSPQSNVTSLFEEESDDDLSTSPSSTEFEVPRKSNLGQPQHRHKDFGTPDRPYRKHTKPYIEDEGNFKRRSISPPAGPRGGRSAFITPSRSRPHPRENQQDPLMDRKRHEGVPMPRVVQAPRHFRPPGRPNGNYESDLGETERRFSGLRLGSDRRGDRDHDSRDRGSRGRSREDRSRDRSPDRGYRSDSYYRNSFDQRLPPRRNEPPKTYGGWSGAPRGYSSGGNHSASPRYRDESPRRQQYARHHNDESYHRQRRL